jgi:hypothetical protein
VIIRVITKLGVFNLIGNLIVVKMINREMVIACGFSELKGRRRLAGSHHDPIESIKCTSGLSFH